MAVYLATEYNGHRIRNSIKTTSSERHVMAFQRHLTVCFIELNLFVFFSFGAQSTNLSPWSANEHTLTNVKLQHQRHCFAFECPPLLFIAILEHIATMPNIEWCYVFILYQPVCERLHKNFDSFTLFLCLSSSSSFLPYILFLLNVKWILTALHQIDALMQLTHFSFGFAWKCQNQSKICVWYYTKTNSVINK